MKYQGGCGNLEADIFAVNIKPYICVVNCHRKFPVVKQVEGFSTDNLIKTCNINISGYGLPSEIVSDVAQTSLQIN